MPSRGLLALFAATMVTVLLCWFAVVDRYSRVGWSIIREEDLIFPRFQHQMSGITDMEVARADGKFALSRSENAWANTGLGGFPAVSSRVESVLVAVAGMKYIAPKTKRSRLHHRLHVEDVTSTARSTRLTFKDGAGAVLADVIIGKPKDTPDRPGVYVRLPGEDQVWLSEGVYDVRHDMVEWSDRVVANLDARFMRAITVSHPSRETVALYRSQPQDRKMKLKNLPAGAAIEQRYEIEYMEGLLRDLEFIDARRAGRYPPMAAPAFKVVAHWNSQLVVTLHTDEPRPDGAVWARVEGRVNDNSQASEFEKREAARIRSKFDGWIVKLPRKFTDRIEIRLDDIILSKAALQ